MATPAFKLETTLFGRQLAERVAATLDQGHELGYGHRDYCGMGLAFMEGHYCYDEVNDGRMPLLEDILQPNNRGAFCFTDREKFVAWLAAQSDHSLGRLEQDSEFYHGNQTVTEYRLLDFVRAHESFPQITLPRFASLWRAIPAEGDPGPFFHFLHNGYAEDHRHYHNLQHLNECLVELDGIVAQAHNPAALEVALWFHDVVYVPAKFTNELMSADLAHEFLTEGKVNKRFIKQVRDLILITKSHTPSDTPDADLMCDIDLAILGQDEPRFVEYENAIRQEYAAVPIEVYARKRAEILTRFLEREHLYQTENFRDRYEATARRNLAWSIQMLGKMA